MPGSYEDVWEWGDGRVVSGRKGYFFLLFSSFYGAGRVLSRCAIRGPQVDLHVLPKCCPQPHGLARLLQRHRLRELPLGEQQLAMDRLRTKYRHLQRSDFLPRGAGYGRGWEWSAGHNGADGSS